MTRTFGIRAVKVTVGKRFAVFIEGFCALQDPRMLNFSLMFVTLQYSYTYQVQFPAGRLRV